jgi:cell division protein FtsB
MGDDEVARLADAMQAADFRDVLAAMRAHLDTVMVLVRNQLQTHIEAGDRLESHRLQQQLSEQEDELKQLDSPVGRIEQRFTDRWADPPRS